MNFLKDKLNFPRLRLLLIIFIVVIIVATVIFLPVKFPYTISSIGKILPSKSWIVSKGNSGQLISFLEDRGKGIVDHYSVKEFERGDEVHLSLIPDFQIGKTITKKDTIGYIYSNVIEIELTRLKSELDVAKSSLSFNLTGEKEAVINEAKENLNYYIKQASEQKNILARQKALYEKNLLSKEEYEITLNLSELYDISVDIAKARLESVSTGAKKEQIELIQNQIKSLQNQIEVFQKRSSSYNLISPIDGMVSNLSSGDTLFIISDNIEFVVMIPVKVSDVEFVRKDSEIKIKLPYYSSRKEEITGRVKFVDNSTFTISGNQMVMAIASINSVLQDKELASGLMSECEIKGGSITIYEHLRRFMNRTIF